MNWTVYFLSFGLQCLFQSQGFLYLLKLFMYVKGANPFATFNVEFNWCFIRWMFDVWGHCYSVNNVMFWAFGCGTLITFNVFRLNDLLMPVSCLILDYIQFQCEYFILKVLSKVDGADKIMTSECSFCFQQIEIRNSWESLS